MAAKAVTLTAPENPIRLSTIPENQSPSNK
jgi:hypothetical protein